MYPSEKGKILPAISKTARACVVSHLLEGSRRDQEGRKREEKNIKVVSIDKLRFFTLFLTLSYGIISPFFFFFFPPLLPLSPLPLLPASPRIPCLCIAIHLFLQLPIGCFVMSRALFFFLFLAWHSCMVKCYSRQGKCKKKREKQRQQIKGLGCSLEQPFSNKQQQRLAYPVSLL